MDVYSKTEECKKRVKATCLERYGVENYMQSQYRSNVGILKTHIHPLVEKGASYVDGVFLNNHGVKHIQTVIKRATQLVSTPNFNLSSYEIYILLMGIHLHDVGNLLGRQAHENKIHDIISAINNTTASLGFEDDVEREEIEKIAGAHGGSYDALLNLSKEVVILNHHVHSQQIASIIRLADEISDDYSRSDKVMLQARTLPPEAIIYHLYSHCLKTAEYVCESNIISYIFRIEEQYLHETFLKKRESKEESVYLLDEIYCRTLKTFKEVIFCVKHLRPYIVIDRVRVSIDIKLEEKDNLGHSVVKSIKYDLCDNGYPSVEMEQLCPKIAELTGSKVAEQLKKKIFEDVRIGN